MLDAMPHNADDLNGRGLMASLGKGKDRSFNKITKNWVMSCTSIVGNSYVSNAAMTLETVLTIIPLFFDGVSAPFFMLHMHM